MTMRGYLESLTGHPEVYEKRRSDWNTIVQNNPDLNDPSVQKQFLKTGIIPTKRSQPLRITSGQKTETPLPGGGTQVEFPETTVSQPRPLHFGNPEEVPGYVDKAGNFIKLETPPELEGQKLKVLTQEQVTGKPANTMDALLAQKVASGEITLEQAMAMKKSSGGSGAYALTPEEDNALVAAMRRDVNPLPPSLIRSRGPIAKAMAHALIQDPNYNPSAAEIEFATAKQGSTSEAGQRGKTVGSIEPMANSLEDILDYAEPLVKVLAPTQIAAVNQAYLDGLQQINDPDANRLLTHLNEATAMYASIMKGGNAAPTDQQFQDAKLIIRKGLSAEGFTGVADAIRKAARSRVKRLRQAPGKHNAEVTNTPGSSGEKPKTVMQNGHTYTLNEATGEYE